MIDLDRKTMEKLYKSMRNRPLKALEWLFWEAREHFNFIFQRDCLGTDTGISLKVY